MEFIPTFHAHREEALILWFSLKEWMLLTFQSLRYGYSGSWAEHSGNHDEMSASPQRSANTKSSAGGLAFSRRTRLVITHSPEPRYREAPPFFFFF